MAAELSWHLASSDGLQLHLPHEMLFVGRYECELVLKSDSVDKQHAVLNYDSIQDAFRIKDLGTLNGTYVNDTRLPEQIYITLNNEDRVKFGHDPQTFTIAKLVQAKDNDQINLCDKMRIESSLSYSASQSKAIPNEDVKLRSSTSFIVTTSHKDAVDASKAKTYLHHASERKAKKISTALDKAKQLILSQRMQLSSSVDCQVVKNEPATNDDNPLLEKDDVLNNHGRGDLKKNNLKVKTVSGSFQMKLSAADASTPNSKRGKSPLPSQSDSSVPYLKESLAQSTKKSSESSNTNSNSEGASESGTYTIENEATEDDKLDTKSATHDLQQIGGATTDPSELRSNWVKEWVGKHQITPIPVEQSCNDEDADIMSRSGSEGQRIRRSLPSIPVSAVKAAQRALQNQELENEISAKNENYEREKRRHSSTNKRHFVGKINEQQIPVEGAIKQDAQQRNVASKRSMTSFETSHPQLAMTLQALQEQFNLRPKENQSITDDQIGAENRSGNDEDVSPPKLRHPTSNCSSSKNFSVFTKKQSISSNGSPSSSCGSSPEPPLIRSSSFIKTEPSGVVPASQVPDVTQPARLFRSSSFIKDSPGLPEELIPRISPEVKFSPSEVDAFIHETSHSKRNPAKVVSKNLSQKPSDQSYAVDHTNRYPGDHTPRPRPHQATSNHSKPRKTKEYRLKRPVASNSNPITSKTNAESPKPSERLPSSALSSDDCSTSASDRLPKKSASRTANVHSDTESLPLKLTRTTLLRQHKAKEAEKHRLKRAASASPLTTMSLPKELPQKNKSSRRKSLERLDALSKPLPRRMPRSIETASSDMETRSKPPRRKQDPQRRLKSNRSMGPPCESAGCINPSRRASRDRKSSDNETHISRKLSADFPRRSMLENRESERFEKGHCRALNSPRDNLHGYDSLDCLATSGSDYDVEIDKNNNNKAEDKTFTHNRSPPDGEMSDEIARLSHDIVSDIQRLTAATKSTDSNRSSPVAVNGSGASETEHQTFRKTSLDSPPKAQPRKTWHSGRNALDGLMLSNVCALSSRISSVADLVMGKISILHGCSPRVNLSKSHVPLLQQTATQEMAAIVNNLRRVEMQLLRADKILDPDCKLQDLVCD